MTNILNRFMRDDSGATMIEYALMVALIAVVCLVAVTSIGTKASTKFNAIASSL